MQALLHLGHGPAVAHVWPIKEQFQNLRLVIGCVYVLCTIGPNDFRVFDIQYGKHQRRIKISGINIEVEQGSGNVYADLGVPNPEKMLV